MISAWVDDSATHFCLVLALRTGLPLRKIAQPEVETFVSLQSAQVASVNMVKSNTPCCRFKPCVRIKGVLAVPMRYLSTRLRAAKCLSTYALLYLLRYASEVII